MGDGDRLPPSALNQCGSDYPLSSLAVNSRESRLAAGRLTAPARIPTGMPKRTDRVFRQLVDRKISPAKLDRRILTNDNRNDRQVRQVVGGVGQRGK
jgi:hypothetical protein